MRQNLLQDHFYMYGHSTVMSNASPNMYMGKTAVRFNLVQSCVDTLINKISKNKPRPTFLTDNGDWGLRKRAQKQEKFVFGMFQKLDVYKKSKRALLDCLVWGDGFVKVYSRGKDIYVEPALTTEIIVDEQEAMYGTPRQMWQIRFMVQEQAADIFPDVKEAIMSAQTVTPPFYFSIPVVTSKLILLVEYWKLPERSTGPNGETILKGGEHRIICGDQDVIPPEEWKRETFPFAKISYVPNLVGYWSKGVTEIITSHQIEVNRTLKRISDALRLIASPKVLYEYTSKIIAQHFNNDVGAMISYTGTPPQFIMPQAVGPELFAHLENIVNKAYAEVGVSQLTASSEKPAGLNSGKALREYNDIETERFAALGHAWEDLHIDIAELLLEEAKTVAEKYGNYEVMAPDKKGCDVLDFKGTQIDKDKRVIQVYPSSMLPKTPAGRLEYVQEMMASQLITPEEGLSLLDYPDTEKVTRFKNAQFNDIMATIDYMLDKDMYLPPEPYQSLQVGIKYMQSAYLEYKNDGCPEEKLELLIRWINDATALLAPPEDPEMDATAMENPEAMNGLPEDIGGAPAEQEIPQDMSQMPEVAPQGVI